jgi:hypothetical protein
MNFFALAADAMVFVHLLYVSFTIGGTLLILTGGILKWRWVRNRRFRFLHLGAVVLVAVEALAGVWCPLTTWEWRLRARAGQDFEGDISFVGRLIRKIIFIEIPDWGFTLMYVGFALLVVAVYILIRPDRREGIKDR